MKLAVFVKYISTKYERRLYSQYHIQLLNCIVMRHSNYFFGGLPESFCCLSLSFAFFALLKTFSLIMVVFKLHTHHNHKKAIDEKMFSLWMAVVAAHSCQKMILIALRLSFEVAHHTLSIYYIHHQYPFYKCLHKNWKGLL